MTPAGASHTSPALVRAGPKAIIVGAGIGGLSAAIALRQAGLDVAVFEQAPTLHEVGTGLSLWANAIHALNELGVGGAVSAASVPYTAGGLRASDGTILSAISTHELERLFGVAVVVMRRADLLQALLSAVAPGDVRLGARCTGFRQDAQGVAVEFADGRRVSGDLLIAADGLHSVVRAALHGDERPTYAGCTAWRAIVTFDGDAVRATETWGAGAIFGQVPISGNRVYWYAAKKARQGERSVSPKAELRHLFQGWHAPIEALIEAADESTILQNDIFDRPGLTSWGDRSVTLLGDAAHPMTPFLGQGACQAIEDAVVLGRCLRGSTDVPAALRAYERERIPRANAFVTRSRQVGRIARLRNPLAIKVRNALLRRISPERQARQLAQMIGRPVT